MKYHLRVCAIGGSTGRSPWSLPAGAMSL